MRHGFVRSLRRLSRTAALRLACLLLLCQVAGLAVGACRLGTVVGRSVAFEQNRNGDRKWTLLVYMNGDNELEPQAVRSLNQMESVDLDATGITLLVLFDRTPGYDTSNDDWVGTRLFQVEFDSEGNETRIASPTVSCESLGLGSESDVELDMGDPETLTRFLSFARSRYPSDHLGLIIWGHGSGWRSVGTDDAPESSFTRAVSFDDSSGSDPLHTSELGEALRGGSVDFVGFDCCSEAMIEVAYELRDAASYLVASEDVIQSDGWDYGELLRRIVASDLTPLGVAASAVDAFAAVESDTTGATVSAVDLRDIEEVMSALNEFSDVVSSSIHDIEQQAAVRNVLFLQVEDFYAVPGDLNLDIEDMARVVAERLPEASAGAAALSEAVDGAVVAEWHHPQGHPKAHGLAVHYVPLDGDGTALVHADAYFGNLATEYPLSFVAYSSWVPQYPSGPGLLYRLWYEVF